MYSEVKSSKAFFESMKALISLLMQVGISTRTFPRRRAKFAFLRTSTVNDSSLGVSAEDEETGSALGVAGRVAMALGDVASSLRLLKSDAWLSPSSSGCCWRALRSVVSMLLPNEKSLAKF